MEFTDREASLDVEDEEFGEETGEEREGTANRKQKLANDFEDSSEEEDDDDDEEAARVRVL
jgi:transcription elongation factor SPT6